MFPYEFSDASIYRSPLSGIRLWLQRIVEDWFGVWLKF